MKPPDPTPENIAREMEFWMRDSERNRTKLVLCIGPGAEANTITCPYKIAVREGAGWCRWCLPRTYVA